jgi:hypothetical protein
MDRTQRAVRYARIRLNNLQAPSATTNDLGRKLEQYLREIVTALEAIREDMDDLDRRLSALEP